MPQPVGNSYFESMAEKFAGNDNYGHPKADYITKIRNMTPALFYEEMRQKIWLSAYAANNIRSDYHWMCDACYGLCEEKGNDDPHYNYDRAHKMVMKECGY